MKYQTWYINFLVKHPYIVLLVISVFACTCLTLPFTVKILGFPSFQDPQEGFSTRGTKISNAITSWRNLEMESSKTSGYLIKNPKEYFKIQERMNQTSSVWDENEPYFRSRGERKKPKKHKHKYKHHNEIEHDHKNETIYGKIITSERNTTEGPDVTNKWQYLQNLTDYIPENKHTSYEKHFCGSPDERYSHVVISSKEKKDLFTWENLLSVCRFQSEFVNLNNFKDLCIPNTQMDGKCCEPWSLPNYIAVLHNKDSCLKISESEVNDTKTLLIRCAPYFHHNELYTSCIRKKGCKIPLECLKHDTVFNILNYLTGASFLPPNDTKNIAQPLEETIIFLPVAASLASVPLYHEIEKMDKYHEGLLIVAMDMGIKSIIFDEYLLRDIWFMCIGAVFIFMCVWSYTTSLFLTLMTIIAITFAMAITYFFYHVVYELAFFPFMNLLTMVIVIGIGADDAFILCKIWRINKNDQSNENNLSKIMTATINHAFKSMFVTMLTTAVAFWGSYVSSVTAISCFSIFAGTAIIINFLLMVSWFPACLVIWEQSNFLNYAFPCHFMALTQLCVSSWNVSRIICKGLNSLWNGKKEFITKAVIKLKYLWLILFTAVAIGGIVVVFLHPKLKLPSSREFQLFSLDHPFEQYDFIYKDKFWFRREKGEFSDDYKLPLRFVWGVLPVDNGDHLNPKDFGDLEFDDDFDMADPASQKWLRDFCENIKYQPFFEPMLGISLTSCVIETFVKSMNRRCYDEFIKRNLTPCCELSDFPFNESIFETCIVEEMAEIYSGPVDFTYPKTAGVIFSKTKPAIVRAIVVEFESNFTFSMSYENLHEFYTMVNEWTEKQLETAPTTMKNGFFVSDLDFYDLQNELSSGTKVAIFVSMGLASAVLFISTLNPMISMLAIVTITFSIITTIAALVLRGWTLNILESIAVSTAIGLDVDFSLHYCINYKLCPPNMAGNREEATRYALSCIMGPSFMAALTTAAAGFFMTFSLILPYCQIGLFLVLLMAVSWSYATFFLGALLATLGPTNDSCQFTFKGQMRSFLGNRQEPVSHTDEAMPSTSSSQDLDRVSFIKRDTPKPVKKKSFKEPIVKYTPSQGLTDQSPSSNITIIMTDDN